MGSLSVRASFTGLLLLLAAPPALALSYRDTVLTDAPLAYWRLGDTGPTVADETGNGHTGTADAGVSFGEGSLLASDLSNTAVGVSGADRIGISGFEKYGSGATGYSVEFWLTLNTGADASFHNLVGDGEGAFDFFSMTYLTPTGNIRPHFRGSGTVSFDSAAALSAGSTHYVVTTWDQSSGLGSIYIDGALDSSLFVGTGAPLDTANTVYIGRDDREPGGDFVLDEVAIYDYALSPTRISDHHAAAAVPEPTSALLVGGGLVALGILRGGRGRRAGNSGFARSHAGSKPAPTPKRHGASVS